MSICQVEYFAALSDEVKAGIDEVCINMWRPYAQAVVQELPVAELLSLTNDQWPGRRHE